MSPEDGKAPVTYRSEEDLRLIAAGVCRDLLAKRRDEAAIDSGLTQLEDYLGPLPRREVSFPDTPKLDKEQKKRYERLAPHRKTAHFLARLSMVDEVNLLVDHFKDKKDSAVILSAYRDGVAEREKDVEPKSHGEGTEIEIKSSNHEPKSY